MNGAPYHWHSDAAWPWSIPGWGPFAFVGVAGFIALFTCWTYLGSPKVSRTQLTWILALRLFALAIVGLLTLRPSVAWDTTEGLEPSRLIVVGDASESMATADTVVGTRWDAVKELLASQGVRASLSRLADEQKIDTLIVQGAANLTDFSPTASPVGKRTDIGGWLDEILQKHAKQTKLRGIILISDGIDNGIRFAALERASAFKGVCPIQTLIVGKSEDPQARKDILVASVKTPNDMVGTKSKMTVQAQVLATGFPNATARVRVWLEGSSGTTKKSLAKEEKIELKSSGSNPLTLTIDSPDKPDEYKLSVSIDPLPGEATEKNNENFTFFQTTKEGVNVLWVEERIRPYEPIFVQKHVLKSDQRFRVFEVLGVRGSDPFGFNQRSYDVLVIGDISSATFSRGQPNVFQKIREAVQTKKMGLLLLGGSESFGRGGWHTSPIADLFPTELVDLDPVEKATRFLPTKAGRNERFLQLHQDEADFDALWSKRFDPLDGYSPLGKPRSGSTVLAANPDGVPLLVAGQRNGRILAFAGDSTWKSWRMSPEAIVSYARFWKQMILWLAQQDDAGKNLWVDLDSRRIPQGGAEKLQFRFGLNGKQGSPIVDAKFDVHVVAPSGDKLSAPTTQESDGKHRGVFAATAPPGEYRLVVKANGKDSDGSLIQQERAARFVLVTDDLEMQRLGADPELMEKIATVSGGKSSPANESALLKLLEETRGLARDEAQHKTVRWPDWNRSPPTSEAGDQLQALWRSTTLFWFLAFVALLSTEWLLRRSWGMV